MLSRNPLKTKRLKKETGINHPRFKTHNEPDLTNTVMQYKTQKTWRQMHRELTLLLAIYVMLFQLLVPTHSTLSEEHARQAQSHNIADKTTDQTLCFLVEAPPLTLITSNSERNIQSVVCWCVPVTAYRHAVGSFVSTLSALRLILSSQFLKLQINLPMRN